MRYTPQNFNWLSPAYVPVWQERERQLNKLKADPLLLARVKFYYKHHIADFISDWGITVDPRNAGSERPVLMPFCIFPKQREFIEFLSERWQNQSDGIMVKSRTCGASWLAMGWASSMCLFWENVSFGFGSATEDKVDRSGDPDCLFYKGRQFLKYLPAVFKGGWHEHKHSAHMRIMVPHTGSSITGDAGKNIGRGGRKTAWFLDEFAFVEHPKVVDAAVSAATNCRIEMSTVNGLANTFAERARGGLIKRFDFHYRDDPRCVNLGAEYECDYKEDDGTITHIVVKPGDLQPWFARKLASMDPMNRKSEYECDFLASIEGGVIEAVWIESAWGAAQKLNVEPSGAWLAAFDVADQGNDKNAVAIRHGIELVHVEEWSGNNSNPMTSIRKAFEIADVYGVTDMIYDGSGMGGTWHEYFALVNAERKERGQTPINMTIFQGGGAVEDPDVKPQGIDRTNKDYYENFKAQCWMAIRMRFVEMFKALNGDKYDAEMLITIRTSIALRSKVTTELAQPTRKWSKNGKLMIDKTPDGVASPNMADAIMMVFGYYRPPLKFTDEALAVI